MNYKTIKDEEKKYVGQAETKPIGNVAEKPVQPVVAETQSVGARTTADTQNTQNKQQTAPATYGYTSGGQSQYDAGSNQAYQNAMAALEQAKQSMPTYSSSYDQQIMDLYNQITNRPSFNYNMNEDALYQQYKDMYTQQGKMAMMDTMGQAAALTGGYGSSYGQNVGQQAYQGYLQQLNDIVPELHGQAYNRYAQEGQDLLNQYSMLGDLRNEEYSRYQDALSQYWQNLNYLQGQADDAYSRGYNEWYNQQQLDYQKERDAIADKQWQTEYDENKRRYDQEWAQSQSRSYSGGGSGSSGSRNKLSNSQMASIRDAYENGGVEALERELQLMVINGDIDDDFAEELLSLYLPDLDLEVEDQNKDQNKGQKAYSSSGSSNMAAARKKAMREIR